MTMRLCFTHRRQAGIMSILLGVGLVWPAAAVAAKVAVHTEFTRQGLASLTVDAREFLSDGSPAITHAVLEQRDTSKPGIGGYTFEEADVSKPRVTVDVPTRTVKHAYAWGTAVFLYTPGADRLTIAVTIANTSKRTLATFGLTLCRIKLPSPPANLKSPGRGRIVSTLDHIGAITADYGSSSMLACCETMDPPLYFGLAKATDKAATTFPIRMRGDVFSPEAGKYVIHPRGLPRIQAGKSVTLTFSLRFMPAGGDRDKLLGDIYARFRTAHKPAPAWKDRRPIGMVMMSSSYKGHVSKTNPRGWFNDARIDINDKPAFRKRVLAAADGAIKAHKDTGAQGMILWDVEATQHRSISYVGDPRMAPKLAPELDAVADEYFKKFRDAGLRTGICIRPTQVYFDKTKNSWSHGTGSDGSPDRGNHYPNLRPPGTPWWRFYPIVERMCDKIAYARKRWGCTLYYIDTNGTYQQCGQDAKFKWMLLSAHILKAIHARHPDVLLIPELVAGDGTYHSAYWSCSAPYFELDLRGYSTPHHVRKLLPRAMSIINISDGPFDEKRDLLLEGIKRGDILMFHGWYGAKRNAKVKALYKQASDSLRAASPAKTSAPG